MCVCVCVCVHMHMHMCVFMYVYVCVCVFLCFVGLQLFVDLSLKLVVSCYLCDIKMFTSFF